MPEFTWFAQPHAYGFISASSDHSTPSRAEVEDAIRNFLSMIDPDAGYIEDE